MAHISAKKINNSIMAIILVLSYLSLFLILPLKDRLSNLDITSANNYIFIGTVAILLINFICYVKLKPTWKFKHLFLALISVSALLIFIWPITSIDIYSYIYRARVWTAHGLNPYFEVYKNLSQDTFYDLINNRWSYLTTPYGPLFVIISALLAWLGKGSFLLSLFLFKLAPATAHILSSYLIYKLSRSKLTFYLYAFNPLVLFEFIVNGHNDVYMILGLLAALWIINRQNIKLKHALLAVLFLTLSAMIKFISLIFLPIFVLLLINKFKTNHKKIIFFILAITTFLVTSALLYLPFWQGWSTLSRIAMQSNIKAFFVASPAMHVGLAAADILGYSSLQSVIIILIRLLFLAAYSYLLYQLLKPKKTNLVDIIGYCLTALALFYFLFLTWLTPWYYGLLLALLLLYYSYRPYKPYLYISYALTAWGIINYILLR